MIVALFCVLRRSHRSLTPSVALKRCTPREETDRRFALTTIALPSIHPLNPLAMCFVQLQKLPSVWFNLTKSVAHHCSQAQRSFLPHLPSSDSCPLLPSPTPAPLNKLASSLTMKVQVLELPDSKVKKHEPAAPSTACEHTSTK